MLSITCHPEEINKAAQAMSLAHFTKQPWTITDIVIASKSLSLYKKRMSTGHIMFLFKIDKIPLTGFLVPQRAIQDSCQKFNTKKNMKEKRYLHILRRKGHLFESHSLKY